jgi:16S rRNA (guanine527-N7)-methyltransferase
MMAGEALAAGAAALGLELDDAKQAKLLAYLTLLEKWNRTHNLTAVHGRERMLSHHLLDSLAVLPHLPVQSGMRLIDVGSGGGLPGIPLAIARPDWHVALLDSNQKKSAFLRQAVAELKLADAEVVTARAETYVPDKPFFELAIARAVSELAQFVKMAAHLVGTGGRLLAMKGSYPEAEIAALPPGVRVVAVPRLHVPGIEGERHLVILEKHPG